MGAGEYAAYFFGSVFLTNAVPHFVSGIKGQPFQTPFSTPLAKGLSSSTVNVIWGSFNIATGYVLLLRVGDFDLRATDHAAVAGLGVVVTGVLAARYFGRFHGGLAP